MRQLVRYVHLNPVNPTKADANIKLEEYAYSSHSSWFQTLDPTGLENEDVILDKGAVMRFAKFFNHKADYMDFIESKISSNEKVKIDEIVIDS